MSREANGRWGGPKIARLFGIAAGVTLAVFVVMVAPTWIQSLYQQAIPPWLHRRIISLFLKGLLVGYFAGVLAAAIGIACALLRSRRAQRSRTPRPRWVARVLAFGVIYLLGLGLLEGAAAGYSAWNRQPPPPPPPPTKVKAEAVAPADGPAKSKDDTLSIVVVGESSARGEPYHTWLSVGQILGWELQKVPPDRKVEVDMRAVGGAPLEPMQRVLFEDVKRRPDAVLIYSGHNEFQARYSWSHGVSYYVDDFATNPRVFVVDFLGKLTPLCRLIRDTIELHSLSTPPPAHVTRELVDRPTCTDEDWKRILAEFGRRLESMVEYCERIGAVPILVIPAGNDAGFEPDRSVLPPETDKAARDAFAADFRRARALEAKHPDQAISSYRRLLERQPGFAESHFRLARLLEQNGQYAEANAHYIRARDLDGLPMRCPTPFQDAYRTIAARHKSVILVDGQAVLSLTSPTGILDGRIVHDGQHPTLRSYVSLAQVALDQIAERGVLGWPKGVAAPEIDPDACAREAGLNPERWDTICDRIAFFFRQLAFIRFDPFERSELEKRWSRAQAKVRSGLPPEESGIPGLGTHPEGLLSLDRVKARSLRSGGAPAIVRSSGPSSR